MGFAERPSSKPSSVTASLLRDLDGFRTSSICNRYGFSAFRPVTMPALTWLFLVCWQRDDTFLYSLCGSHGGCVNLRVIHERIVFIEISQ